MEKRKQRGKQKSHQARDDAKEANEDIVKERTEQITDETLPEFLRGTLSRDDSIRETSERGLRRFQNNPRSMDPLLSRTLSS